MKKKLLILLGIIFIVSIFVLGILISPKGGSLTEIGYDELIQKLDNKESFVLYAKQDSCSHCKTFTPILEDVFDDYGIDAYYIRLNNLTEEEAVIDDGGLAIVNTDLYISSTPSVLFINKGVENVMDRVIGVNKSAVIHKLKNNGYIK